MQETPEQESVPQDSPSPSRPQHTPEMQSERGTGGEVNLFDALKWDEHSLVPAVVQDAASGAVLMVAWMNAESLQMTLDGGEAVFWSRSRGKLWRKGETSGNVMRIVEIRVDCDADTLLLSVNPAGPACHTGAPSCFYRTLKDIDS